jgi:SAM-dependent methyltransferase
VDFAAKSKLLHKEYSSTFWAGAFDPEHPDTKRHYEMLSSSDGLLDHLQPLSILSVGDNLARDAGYFKRKFPNSKCIASDLYAEGIQDAVTHGWVDAVISADVEALPFGNAEIDCVIAKEAFHHWPRPMLGLYEMLRVAKKAILLIEPYDVMHGTASPFIGGNTFCDDYESVGNYKYQISLREITKSAWSLYYPAVAAVGFNDPYDANRSFDEWILEKRKLDELGDTGARQFNLMSIAIYKPGYAPAPESLPPRAHYYSRPINHFIEGS